MKSVLEYLESSTNLYSEKIAIKCENESVTYKELLNSSQVIGTNLSKYINLNDPVIVFMDKGIITLEVFFGILYAGGCYSLVNPDFPSVRLKEINNVLSSKIIITNEENFEKANSVFENSTILNINDLLKGRVNQDILNSIRNNKLDIDPVYINFTSGSTGTPKGVVVSNRSIIDFIPIFTSNFNINKDDLIANQAPFDFDVSVKDIYSSIFVGATLVIVPKAYFSNPVKLLDYLVDNQVTTLIWAVSALCLITTFHGLDYKVPDTVNKILFSGEVMPIKHLNLWMNALPRTMFVNLYGPTEITCNCTYYIIDHNKMYEKLPIGIPFKNEKVFLLNENNELINVPNISGEICVSGTCLGLGYYNNTIQTNKSFIQNPLNNHYNEMIYKTGDLAEYDQDGNLVFTGRKDFQIKYMGHRIELEEIDRAIMKIEGVKRVCTIFIEKKNKLYCFYIGDITREEIIESLNKSVPIYMIPSVFKKIDEFVLNKNGKIDRKYLESEVLNNGRK